MTSQDYSYPSSNPQGACPQAPANGVSLLHTMMIWLWTLPLTDTDLSGLLRAMARYGVQGSGDTGAQLPGSSSCQPRSYHLPGGCKGWAWGSPALKTPPRLSLPQPWPFQIIPLSKIKTRVELSLSKFCAPPLVPKS